MPHVPIPFSDTHGTRSTADDAVPGSNFDLVEEVWEFGHSRPKPPPVTSLSFISSGILVSHCDQRDTSLAMSPLTVSAKQPACWEGISIDVVRKNMHQCLGIVMEWQKIKFPSRFVIGGGDLRKLTFRIREQPINFMTIICQSILTAKNGERSCRAGWRAAGVLLGEEDSNHSKWNRTRFTEETITEIKKSASILNRYTKDMHLKFRHLRATMLELHNETNAVKSKRDRADFFVRLSRHLSTDVQVCEGVVWQVYKDLEMVENTLNLITRWWQKVESEANYLEMNGESPLLNEKNTITLREIRDGFVMLKKYFDDYIAQMGKLYDANIVKLSSKNRKYLENIERSGCADPVVSSSSSQVEL